MSIDLLGAYWTTAGPVQIGTGREWSLFDWPERCAEAARTGMRGLGIWHADLEHLLHRYDLTELRRIFDDNGLEYLELEFLNDWFLAPDDPRRAEADRYRAMLFDAAAQLRAHHIKVGNLKRTKAEPGRLVEGFALLCADAARHHDAAITYELMPFDPNVGSLEAVVALADGAGTPNGGIALDTWHLGKMGITPEDLLTIPPRLLSYVELSDGMRRDMPDLSHETTRHRRLPGEGEFDIPGYIRALSDLGYRGPWGVEVLSDELRAMPMDRMFRRTVETSLCQFDQRHDAAAGARQTGGQQ